MKKIDLKKYHDLIDYFYREIEVMQNLQHPNIIKYYEHFTYENWLCIVMEYADGESLEGYLRSKKSLLSEEEILKIGSQIAAGLAYIHSKGIVHRDLKSDNVFLCSNGLAKIGDFGFSKSTNVSVIQTMVGTPAYLSPEIILEKPYAFEVDCWALGCILYELTSLKKAFPFSGTALNHKILNEDPEALVGWYSPELFVLVKDLLNKDQSLRLPSYLCVQHPIFAQAFISLGMKFQQGDGCNQDFFLSNFYLQLALNAANSRNPGWNYNSTSIQTYHLRQMKHEVDVQKEQDSIYKYSLSLIKGTDSSNLSPEEACLIFKKEAEKGNIFFMSIYGRTFDFGYGSQSKNATKAMKWYKKSAEAGDALGMSYYGASLVEGFDGLEPRKKVAMEWFKKSAEAGNALGMSYYGASLAEGFDGLEPRKAEAMEWFKKSAEAGNSEGMSYYGISLVEGFDGEAPRKAEAMKWYKKSAEAGNSDGMENYARALETGLDGSPPNFEAAHFWRQKMSK